MSSAAIRTVALPGASGLLGIGIGTNPVVSFRGYSLTCTVTGIVNFRQGSVSGLILAQVQTPVTTGIDWQYEPAIRCEGDLYVQIVSGTWTGCVRYG
jgi:hypothetical protein